MVSGLSPGASSALGGEPAELPTSGSDLNTAGAETSQAPLNYSFLGVNYPLGGGTGAALSGPAPPDTAAGALAAGPVGIARPQPGGGVEGTNFPTLTGQLPADTDRAGGAGGGSLAPQPGGFPGSLSLSSLPGFSDLNATPQELALLQQQAAAPASADGSPFASTISSGGQFFNVPLGQFPSYATEADATARYATLSDWLDQQRRQQQGA